MRIEEPDKTGVGLPGVLFAPLRSYGEHGIVKAWIPGWASSRSVERTLKGLRLSPIEQAVVECNPEYTGTKVIESLVTLVAPCPIMDTGEIRRTLSSRFSPRHHGPQDARMNVTHGDAVFHIPSTQYGPFCR